MKLTKRKLSIITLALVLVLCISVIIGINVRSAEASSTVTVNNNNVFTASNGASVGGTQVGTPAEGEKPEGYTTFTFTDDDDTVSYRRNVAYHWFEEVVISSGDEEEDEDGEEKEAVTEVREGYFNLEIGFKSTGFEKYIITFESQQYVKTKDGKSQNYIIFYPASADTVYVAITDDKEYEISDDDKAEAITLNSGDIYIEYTGKYTEDYSGGYYVVVGNKTPDESKYEAKVEGKFENVGGNYAKYSSSSTTPVYPLIFNTVFEKNEDGDRVDGGNLEMILFSFNGQKFKTTLDGSDKPTNYVTDDTAPVLCLNQNLTYFKLNGSIDIDYQVIDVLRNNPPSPTIKYYVLSKEQYEGEKELGDKSLFGETKSASNVILSSDKNTYLPSEKNLQGTVFAPSYIVKGGELVVNPEQEKPLCDSLIKVYFEMTDTSTYPETSEVFLDWYMDEEFLVNIEKGGVTTSFIAVAKDELGVSYNYGYGTEEEVNQWNNIVDAYQKKVTELAKNLSAGSSSYFYLPSPESLFSDSVTSYTDMKFNIYYHHGSKQSSTNLSYNNLSINLTKEGTYVFTVYATDTAGNNMYYYEKADADEAIENGVLKKGYVEKGGEYYELVKFPASDIWTMFEDKDLLDKVPWFSFYASYKGVEFEETPGKQSTAYVGTSYSSAKFKINGISGNYTTTYKLYVFDSAKYYSDNKINLSYDKFIDVMDGLFNDPLTHIYFNEIPVVKESDPEYETYKDYGWTGTSTTFTPQEANTFYYMVAEVKDTGKITDPKTCSLAIVATDSAKELSGENDWVKNNVASIVLLVIAGVALVGIVLLIVIKPKNKEDIDVQYEKVKSQKK